MVSPVVDALVDRFGDALRSVGSYNQDSAEIEYVRDDIEAEYDGKSVDNHFEAEMLEALDQRHQESLYAYGDLECTVRCYGDATELHFVEHQTKGVVATIDAGALTDLRETVEECRDVIGE